MTTRRKRAGSPTARTAQELKDDPRTAEAERRLKAAGITEAWWNGLLDRVAALPARYAEVTQETKAEAKVRRRRLAEKMRCLADELDNDPEAPWFFPAYGGVAGQQPCLNMFPEHEQALNLAGWLRACAESFEAGSFGDAETKPLRNRRGVNCKSFVIHGVYHWIEHYLAAGRRLEIVTGTRPKNKETALLASALLDENITANDVTQARRTSREHYPYRNQ